MSITTILNGSSQVIWQGEASSTADAVRRAWAFGFSMANAALTSADFTGGKDLSYHNFHNANLAGCDFTNANLQGADFSGATLTAAKFTNANLNYANFSGANVKGANFSGYTGRPLGVTGF